MDTDMVMAVLYKVDRGSKVMKNEDTNTYKEMPELQ